MNFLESLKEAIDYKVKLVKEALQYAEAKHIRDNGEEFKRIKRRMDDLEDTIRVVYEITKQREANIKEELEYYKRDSYEMRKI